MYDEGYIVATKSGKYFVESDALDEFLQELAGTAKNRLGATKKNIAIWTFELRLVDYGRLGEVYRNITGRDLLSDREPES